MTPIERLFASAVMHCTICKGLMGKCDCWTKCAACGWSFKKGTRCRNPMHTKRRAKSEPLQIVAEGKLKDLP